MPKFNREFLIVNALTFGRVPFVTLFLALSIVHVYFRESLWIAWLAVFSLVLGSITDLFDGMLARKWKVESSFGAMADPLMDKFFYAVVFPVFTWLLPILVRDLWVTFLRAVGSEYHQDCRANWMGKFRTAYSFPFACVAYAHIAIDSVTFPVWLVYLLEDVPLVLTFSTMWTYTRA